MKRENYVMVDIETTGTNKETDDILEIAMVEITRNDKGFWVPTSRAFHRRVFSERQPENDFAKREMAALYAECNKLDPLLDGQDAVTSGVKEFLHGPGWELEAHFEPKFFIGWNASNFDLEFLFKKDVMTPSYYVMDEKKGKEVLKGDAHYRVYEQTGAIEYLSDVTGLDRWTLLKVAETCIPKEYELELPKGKKHDALVDCYSQINMMNGLIALGRKAFTVF